MNSKPIALLSILIFLLSVTSVPAVDFTKPWHNISQLNVNANLDMAGKSITNVGNVGIGLPGPSGLSTAGALRIYSAAPQIDFVDSDNNDWAIHANSNKLYFIRDAWNYQDLVLDGTGNVGIGTASPGAKLDVAGSIFSSGEIRACGGGSCSHLRYGGDNNNYLRGTTYFDTGPAYFTGGNVGIGTNQPAFKLDVAGRARIQAGGGSAGIWFMNGGNTIDRAFVGMVDDNNIGFYGNPVGFGLIMNADNGNVGIQTLPSSYKLDIAGGSIAIRNGGIDLWGGIRDTFGGGNQYYLDLDVGGNIKSLNIEGPLSVGNSDSPSKVKTFTISNVAADTDSVFQLGTGKTVYAITATGRASVPGGYNYYSLTDCSANRYLPSGQVVIHNCRTFTVDIYGMVIYTG